MTTKFCIVLLMENLLDKDYQMNISLTLHNYADHNSELNSKYQIIFKRGSHRAYLDFETIWSKINYAQGYVDSTDTLRISFTFRHTKLQTKATPISTPEISKSLSVQGKVGLTSEISRGFLMSPVSMIYEINGFKNFLNQYHTNLKLNRFATALYDIFNRLSQGKEPVLISDLYSILGINTENDYDDILKDQFNIFLNNFNSVIQNSPFLQFSVNKVDFNEARNYKNVYQKEIQYSLTFPAKNIPFDKQVTTEKPIIMSGIQRPELNFPVDQVVEISYIPNIATFFFQRSTAEEKSVLVNLPIIANFGPLSNKQEDNFFLYSVTINQMPKETLNCNNVVTFVRYYNTAHSHRWLMYSNSGSVTSLPVEEVLSMKNLSLVVSCTYIRTEEAVTSLLFPGINLQLDIPPPKIASESRVSIHAYSIESVRNSTRQYYVGVCNHHENLEYEAGAAMKELRDKFILPSSSTLTMTMSTVSMTSLRNPPVDVRAWQIDPETKFFGKIFDSKCFEKCIGQTVDIFVQQVPSRDPLNHNEETVTLFVKLAPFISEPDKPLLVLDCITVIATQKIKKPLFDMVNSYLSNPVDQYELWAFKEESDYTAVRVDLDETFKNAQFVNGQSIIFQVCNDYDPRFFIPVVAIEDCLDDVKNDFKEEFGDLNAIMNSYPPDKCYDCTKKGNAFFKIQTVPQYFDILHRNVLLDIREGELQGEVVTSNQKTICLIKAPLSILHWQIEQILIDFGKAKAVEYQFAMYDADEQKIGIPFSDIRYFDDYSSLLLGLEQPILMYAIPRN